MVWETRTANRTLSCVCVLNTIETSGRGLHINQHTHTQKQTQIFILISKRNNYVHKQNHNNIINKFASISNEPLNRKKVRDREREKKKND